MPTAGAAASFVYRVFDPAQRVPRPDAARSRAFACAYPDGLFFSYPKSAGSIARDFKWLGSYRYGITHLGGRDEADLRAQCEAASGLLGWTAPYAELSPPNGNLAAPAHRLPAAPHARTSHPTTHATTK